MPTTHDFTTWNANEQPFADWLAAVDRGDTIQVPCVFDLGPNMTQAVNRIHDIHEKGGVIVSVDEPWLDLVEPTGYFIGTLLMAVTYYSKAIMKERAAKDSDRSD